MSHVMIENVGEVPIWGIRLLGLSSKTADQIGQFGTGLKESIVLLCRMGTPPTIYSGSCRVEFEVMGDPEEVHFCLSETRDRFEAGEWYGLGLHPNFGARDWNDPWMALREIVCNAIDEGGLFHDVVSTEPSGEVGKTKFYVPMTTEILTAYSEMPARIIRMNPDESRILQEVPPIGRILAKRSGGSVQIYHRGVWVQEGKEDSAFDYELDDLILNESRSADWYRVHARVATMLSRAGEAQARKLLELDAAGRDSWPWEEKMYSIVSTDIDVEIGTGWVSAWEAMHGKRAVACSNERNNYERLEKKGWRPIVARHPMMLSILRNAGVPTASSVLSRDEQDYDIVREPREGESEVYEEVWKSMLLSGMVPEGEVLPELRIFTQKTEPDEILMGRYDDGKVYLNQTIIGCEQEKRTCVEELCHHLSGQPDHSAGMQNYLVKSVTDLLP